MRSASDDFTTGQARLACCWLAAAFVLPLTLLFFYEAEPAGASGKQSSPLHNVHAFNTFHHAKVRAAETDVLLNVSDQSACARRCDAAAPRCAAFSFTQAEHRCVRHAHASSLHVARGSSASVRESVSWPLHAASRVRWSHNATLVLAWSGGDLHWLRRYAVFDIAVIAVAPPSAMNASGGASAAGARGQHGPAPRELLRFGLRSLKYYAAAPLTPVPTAGGGASASYAAATALAGVSFFAKFYHNLPPLVILADERCGGASGAPGGCAWLSALSAPAQQLAIARALEAGRTQHAPSEEACLCKLAHAAAPPGVPTRALRWFEAQFLGSTESALPRRRAREAPSHLARMQSHDGPIALAAARVRAHAQSSFTALLQLLLVDDKYPGVDAHAWAQLVHAYWLPLVYAAGGAPAAGFGHAAGEVRDRHPNRAHRMSERLASLAGSSTLAAATAPYDACFDVASTCGGLPEDFRGGRLRAEELLRGAREAVRSGIGTVGEHMPVMPQRVRERMRGWWRSARDRTGY